MRGYLLRRLLLAPVILIGVLTLTFALVQFTPGDPFQADRTTGMDPEAAARLRAVFGADRPMHLRYMAWIGSALRGDLGVSYTYRRPVVDVLLKALGPTLLLTSSALGLALLTGVLAAGAAAASGGGLVDRMVGLLGLVLYSAPSFYIGVLLLLGFALKLGWLPPSGMISVDADPAWFASLADRLRHLALPCLTLALPVAAAIALHLRAALEEMMSAPFGTAARARGASTRRVIFVHMLRNGASSTLMLLGLALPGLVGGAVVVEVLFAWPGMGRITYQAILARDLPVVSASVAMAAALTLIGSLAADLGLAVIDPRVAAAGRRSK